MNAELERLNADLQHKMIQVEALQAQLAVEAVHDPLTQLFNRRYLDSVMPGLLGAAERRGTPLALALVDLDHFKQRQRPPRTSGGRRRAARDRARAADVAATVRRRVPLRRRGVLHRAAGRRRTRRRKGAVEPGRAACATCASNGTDARSAASRSPPASPSSDSTGADSPTCCRRPTARCTTRRKPAATGSSSPSRARQLRAGSA